MIRASSRAVAIDGENVTLCAEEESRGTLASNPKNIKRQLKIGIFSNKVHSVWEDHGHVADGDTSQSISRQRERNKPDSVSKEHDRGSCSRNNSLVSHS